MNKKIAVIGGGTGTVAVLSGLKHHDDLDISVIVGMTDDGGSNRVVRDEFGLLPLTVCFAKCSRTGLIKVKVFPVTRWETSC